MLIAQFFLPLKMKQCWLVIIHNASALMTEYSQAVVVCYKQNLWLFKSCIWEPLRV